MAMLAERKSKNKWVLNPRGSNAISEMQLGRKMLEKMGWQSGDGLGVNKQGSTEPLRVHYKNDVKGIGYKKNADNEWLKVEDEFSKFLQNLSSDVDMNANGEMNIESLEKKSEGSKARLHYRKFTRNKDLSRYTEKDLSCILGCGKNLETPEDGTVEEDGKFVDKGSMNGYFEQLTRKKFVQNSVHEIGEIKLADQCLSANENKSKSGKKTKKSEESVDVELSEHNSVFSNNNCSEEVSGRSKRKKCNVDTFENCMEERDNDDGDDCKTKTKKLKKKNKLENSVVNESSEMQQDLTIAESAESYQVDGFVTDSKNKKSKSKKRKFHQVMESDDFISKKSKQEIDEGFLESIENNSNNGRSKHQKKKFRLEIEAEDFLGKTELSVNKETEVLSETLDEPKKKNRKEKSRDKKIKLNETNENDRAVDDHFSISNNANRNEKVKYKKKKCEEINETEAVINVQIQEKDDSLRIGKDSKRKEKSKWKKRKQIDLKESDIRSGSSDEMSAESCDNSLDRSIGTILEKDKNLSNKDVAMKKVSGDEELMANTSPKTAGKICDSVDNNKKETLNNFRKKVRFDPSENFEKEREDNSPQSEDIDYSEKRRSKKPKKQKLVEDGKFENFNEVNAYEEGVKMEQTEASESMNNDQEKGRKDKSNKKLKCKIKVETEESCVEEVLQKPRLSEEEQLEQRLKDKDLTLEDETKKPMKDLDTKNLKVECNISGNDSLRKKKKKSISSQVSGKEHKDQIDKTEITTVDFDIKKVKVECDSFSSDGLKKKKHKSKRNEVSGGKAGEETENVISVKEEESALCDNYHESSEASKKSKSKKHKQNNEKDLIKSGLDLQKLGKPKVSLNGENCSLDSNEIKEVSNEKPLDKKAKLLALLEKTTEDDSDDSDSYSNNEIKEVSNKKPFDKKAKLLALLEKTSKDDSDDLDSDSDGKPVTNLPSSCFKGSNFEKIPGYCNMKVKI